MKIIVDAMGGDNAPQAPVMGAVEANREYGVGVILVGRGETILKVLEDNGIKATAAAAPLAADYDRATAMDMISPLLKTTKYDCIISNNDAMALGALQAIQAAGRTVNKDIYLVGVDALDAAKNEVANGNMTGTVLNDAKGQATQAVASMEELLGGKTFEADHQSVYVDYVKVTPDNVKDFQ